MTWSNLPKSQTDNETIEQAIVRLISQHETDNTSHMGVGESIDVHRKELVLDHAAGSVLADKETNTEFKWNTSFDSLSNFEQSGYVYNTEIIGCNFIVGPSFPLHSYISTILDTTSPLQNMNKDFLFQTILRFYGSASNYNAYFGFLTDLNDTQDGVGFRVINSILYTWVKSDGVLNQVAHSSISVFVDHVYRFQYIAGERKIYFFVDGVVIQVVDILVDAIIDNSTLKFGLQTSNQSNYMSMTSLSLYLAIEL